MLFINMNRNAIHAGTTSVLTSFPSGRYQDISVEFQAK